MTLPREPRGRLRPTLPRTQCFPGQSVGRWIWLLSNCRVEEVNTEYQLENGTAAPSVGPGPKEEGGGHFHPQGGRA